MKGRIITKKYAIISAKQDHAKSILRSTVFTETNRWFHAKKGHFCRKPAVELSNFIIIIPNLGNFRNSK